jgi:acyl-CoA thioester hydrolase
MNISSSEPTVLSGSAVTASACPPHDPSYRSGFSWPIRVYYEDTDGGGIVFYANYLKFFERARTEWLRACGVEQRELAHTARVVFVVRSTALDYLAPARLDDMLTIETRIGRVGRASVEFQQHAWRGEVLLASGAIRVGCVDCATLRPAPLPETVRAALLESAHGQENAGNDAAQARGK